MTNEEKVFYNMLKGGATPEDITKALSNAQRKLDSDKKAEEERIAKEKAEAEAKKKREAQFENDLSDAREDLICSLDFYLPLICPALCPADDADEEEWQKFESGLRKYLKMMEKEILHPNKDKYSKLFDFWF